MTEDSKPVKTFISTNRTTKRRVRMLAALLGIKESAVLENAVAHWCEKHATEFQEVLSPSMIGVIAEPPSWRKCAEPEAD